MAEAKKASVTFLLIMGILTAILGVIAIGSPAVAGTAVVYIVGAIMLIAGISQVAMGLKAEGWSHKLLPLILGTVTTLGGIAVLAHPILGMEILTMILAAYFVAEGIWKVVASFSFRPAQGWLGMLFSGVITWLLGAMIWTQWPASGMWAIGILVGVDLLITGMALIFVAMTLGKIADKIEEVTTQSEPPSEDAAHA
ncbi:acid-resistance membrane protein [Bremerella volcania]|uniref:Acid-resistance membrane protein n=1 Tax=Bremerella volcania TaxID=2527984 RepID=A0A518C698_9BACT|nr:HdeD family acid-resistance protein [Bremerella volcania]QDU74749.1 acid-resistance membrane protein [Bremerella volcania]